ncbi:MAG: 2-octaprenyl-6-methoxyphenyl hydroxylase [Paucimonas sp.]|jgi:2-octaprenyl-6-methoxyphenol hydroxylase|nr:2-octaprenyl-6-methoxyphenyl hydroxylase [Paucimonas sp.]
MSRVNLAIIGGGLVGASLALALQAGARERGWKILLIEPFAPGDSFQPSYDARSSALSFGTRQIYERLGLWQAISRRAEPIRQIQVSDRGRFGATRLDALEEGVPALGYVVENAWLGQCLWQGLDAEVVSWRCPAEVTAMQPLGDGYRLSLNDDTQVDCDLAVLADGGRSDLREQLGIHVSQRPYRQSALIANITPGEAHCGQAFERFTDDGPMALLPLPENRCALVWTRAGMDAKRLAELDEGSFLAELQGVFGYRLGALRQVGARHLYPLTLVEAQEQVRPHLVVLGNAAHSLHPIAGQGFNLSLRDVQSLADGLLAGPDTPGDFATLRAYRERQRLDQDLTVGFSDKVTRLFGTAQPLVATGRNLGLLGLDLLPPAKRWFARQAMGLGTRPDLQGKA